MVWEFIVGAGVGGVAGYFIGRFIAYKDTDISQKSALLSSLTTQVTEMKVKFDAYEKLREQKEKDVDKFSKEREKRYEEFMESTKKFFQTQETIRKESEEKRDKQIEKFSSVISAFSKTIHGTKTRGGVGEDILNDYLTEAIKTKIIKKPLRTDNGEIEFAWNLGDGMYIPIDSKFPDIIDHVSSLTEDTEQGEKNRIRKQIIDKVTKEVNNVKKYQNQSNTINKCILVVPGGALDLCPELIEHGAQKNVFVCAPEQVFLIGYIISEEYQKMKDEGDLGQLKETNNGLVLIIKEILGFTDTIERQAKSVITHNDKIKDKVHEALRL